MKDDSFEKRILRQIGKESSPCTTKRKHVYSERLMPSTLSKNTSDSIDWFSNSEIQQSDDSLDESTEFSENKVYQELLSNETLNSYSPEVEPEGKKLVETTNYFEFKHMRKPPSEGIDYFAWKNTVLSEKSRKLLDSVLEKPRKIPKAPYKTLEAPLLKDDFYLNLVDWSPFENLAVALDKVVYIWNSQSSEVIRLCEMPGNETICSVACSHVDNHVAVATNTGRTLVYNIEEGKEILSYKSHASRIGTLTWNETVLASGSRDKTISLRDIRMGNLSSSQNLKSTSSSSRILMGHKQEVCGVKFSPDGRYLASGGNDNNLLLWDVFGTSCAPAYQFSQHKAAVKALAWSPHKRGLLASGGGTADQEIRFWNSLTGQALSHYHTESQICNMLWSKNTNELVTTHGYSQYEIVVWKYPVMTPTVRLAGHTARVLYLSLSPDGRTIVTGSGDESLRFWFLFDAEETTKHSKSMLKLDNYIR